MGYERVARDIFPTSFLRRIHHNELMHIAAQANIHFLGGVGGTGGAPFGAYCIGGIVVRSRVRITALQCSVLRAKSH